MKLIFAGTPDFAVSTLKILSASGHRLGLVLTQPDRPAGRGLTLQPSPVKREAEALGLPIFQPATLKDAAVQARLADQQADLMIVVAYGLILPPAVIALPRLGCINIHASLLPRWRGAAPIHRALLAGDRETGVSIMAMDAGLDTGPVYRSVPLRIEARETARSLHDRLAALGAKTLVDVLADIESGRAVATPQPTAGACYAPKIDKHEAAIDWSRDADFIDRQIRAFDPFPGAIAGLAGKPCKLWQSELRAGANHGAEPGTVLAVEPDCLVIACGREAIAVAELQLAGGRRLAVKQFLSGHSLAPGARFAPVPGA